MGWGRGEFAFLVSPQVLLLLLIRDPAWAGLVPFTVVVRHIRISSASTPTPRDFVFSWTPALGEGGTFPLVDLRRGALCHSGPIPEKVRGKMDPICRRTLMSGRAPGAEGNVNGKKVALNRSGNQLGKTQFCFLMKLTKISQYSSLSWLFKLCKFEAIKISTSLTLKPYL